ncbi:hypothetical protein IAE_19941, partial [Escherichia coli XH140A]
VLQVNQYTGYEGIFVAGKYLPAFSGCKAREKQTFLKYLVL